MRIKLEFEYDGYPFMGYAKQPRLKTIQGEIEKTLCKVLKTKEVKLHSSGRTDKGVHAIKQVAHFDCISNTINFVEAINSNVCKGINIKNYEVVDKDFHSRYQTTSKEYHYYIMNPFDVFQRNYKTYVRDKLDLDKIEEAINLFIGEHDFTNFTASDVTKSKVREIYSFKLEKTDKHIKFLIKGNGFLKYMIRMIIGSLIELGKGKITKETIKDMLNNPKTNYRKYKADANGLYLYDVKY